MIPKSIYTIWLGDMPDVIKKCIETQKIPGYEHHLITLETMQFMDSEYIQQALSSTYRDGIKYCKMSDYLRMRYLQKYGGIYLDADCWVLEGKNFDPLLGCGMFAARENNGFVGSAVVGAEPGHPFLADWIGEVEKNFRGDDDKNFESSMEILTNLWPKLGEDGRRMALFDTRVFYPYDHQSGTVDVISETRTFHDFTKTWTDAQKDVLPRCSIVLPTLGREDGLRRCLTSINNLHYPKHLIEVIVLDGPGTVPEKVAKGLKQATGEVLVYAANDMTFEPGSLYKAVLEAQRTRGLVAFGGSRVLPDEGNICEHFVIHRDLIPLLENGEIFSTDFNHVGVDNWLWAQAKKLGKATHLEEAKVTHHHFSHGSKYDEVYAKGWALIEKDRAILNQKLETLNGPRHQSTAGGTEEAQA